MEVIWHPKESLSKGQLEELKNAVEDIALQALTPWQHEFEKNSNIAREEVEKADLVIIERGKALGCFSVLLPDELIYCNLIASLQKGFGTEFLKKALKITKARHLAATTRNPVLFLTMQKVLGAVFPAPGERVPNYLAMLIIRVGTEQKPHWLGLDATFPVRKNLYIDNPPSFTLFSGIEKIDNFFFGEEEGELGLNLLDAVMLIG